MVLMLVNCSERKKPPISSRSTIIVDRRRRREAGAGGEEGGADDAIDDQDRAEAEAAQDVAVAPLHAHCAERGGERDQPGLERRHAEAELQHQRQQERQCADAEPER